ncbi:MAG TPA: hypothetical protein VMW84_04080 [Acidobacteriota bacterium]|nr:hypothetical protein [Acidobacteriota bacterium]
MSVDEAPVFLRLKTDHNVWGGEEVLLCPECGSEYIHPTCIKVATGKKVVSVDVEGTTITRAPTPETIRATDRRGARIYLEYCCENGHRGYIILQFRKGNTFIEYEKLPYGSDIATLWRD